MNDCGYISRRWDTTWHFNIWPRLVKTSPPRAHAFSHFRTVVHRQSPLPLGICASTFVISEIASPKRDIKSRKEGKFEGAAKRQFYPLRTSAVIKRHHRARAPARVMPDLRGDSLPLDSGLARSPRPRSVFACISMRCSSGKCPKKS